MMENYIILLTINDYQKQFVQFDCRNRVPTCKKAKLMQVIKKINYYIFLTVVTGKK